MRGAAAAASHHSRDVLLGNKMIRLCMALAIQLLLCRSVEGKTEVGHVKDGHCVGNENSGSQMMGRA